VGLAEKRELVELAEPRELVGLVEQREGVGLVEQRELVGPQPEPGAPAYYAGRQRQVPNLASPEAQRSIRSGKRFSIS
jgi:hypothetical protein